MVVLEKGTDQPRLGGGARTSPRPGSGHHPWLMSVATIASSAEWISMANTKVGEINNHQLNISISFYKNLLSLTHSLTHHHHHCFIMVRASDIVLILVSQHHLCDLVVDLRPRPLINAAWNPSASLSAGCHPLPTSCCCFHHRVFM